MVLDAGKPHYHREILTRELESVGIRLNRSPPNITFRKKKTGGLTITSLVPLTHLDEKMVQRILSEYKIHNADVLLKEDISVDDLIDVIEGNRRYMKCLYVYNKVDVCSIEEVDEMARRPYSIPISCYHQLNLDGLLVKIWDMMGLVRVRITSMIYNFCFVKKWIEFFPKFLIFSRISNRLLRAFYMNIILSPFELATMSNLLNLLVATH